jgi:hypothetical protein
MDVNLDYRKNDQYRAKMRQKCPTHRLFSPHFAQGSHIKRFIIVQYHEKTSHTD